MSNPQVRCPTCAKRIEWSTDNPYRPFCSARCKNVDLGAWANEEYAIPVQAPDDLDDATDMPLSPQ